MPINDYHSPAAFLLFNLTFPFMKNDSSEERLDPITSKDLDTYRCAEITMNILKIEFSKQGIKHPEHYDEVHMHIVEELLKLKQLKNK